MADRGESGGKGERAREAFPPLDFEGLGGRGERERERALGAFPPLDFERLRRGAD